MAIDNPYFKQASTVILLDSASLGNTAFYLAALGRIEQVLSLRDIQDNLRENNCLYLSVLEDKFIIL